MKPELSIIIPCYNCEDTLEEAVESCFVQGLENFEIVMVDDGSTDNTKSVMQELASKHSEINLFFHDVNRGGGSARNTAVDNTQADIIFCLDGDDILPLNVLKRMLAYMYEKKCDGVLFEETKFFSGGDISKTESVKNSILDKPVFFQDMFKNDVGFLVKVNFLYTKKGYQTAGGYPTHHGFDTQTFGYRFLLNGLKVYVCPDTYYFHRRNARISYFDREYKKGNLSVNTYLMYEDFFFLFSKKLKEKIINFDIFKNKKLNKHNLDQLVASEYLRDKDLIFIKNYKKYLISHGEEEYIKENITSGVHSEIFTRAIYFGKKNGQTSVRDIYISLLKIYPKSKILDLKINKKIVLLMHNGGRLGNQLWLMAAMYTYCIEKGYIFDVRCFFEYQEYYNIKIESFLARFFGKVYFFFEKCGLPESILRDFSYGLFTTWSETFRFFKHKSVVYDSEEITQKTFKIFIYKRYKTAVRVVGNIFRKLFKIKKEELHAYATTHNPLLMLLPPSTCKDPSEISDSYTFFTGWLFRNPVGIIKYQKELVSFFTPKKNIDVKINTYVNDLKKTYKCVIGVHVRLGDVVNEFMNNDRIAYSEVEVYSILKEYLKFSNNKPEDTCFVVCSDGKIAESSFEGLHVSITNNNPVEDLWLLSKTDTIIGADSSFAIMASLLGNIPFIVFKRGIDWDYYKDKKTFFINKYVDRFIY